MSQGSSATLLRTNSLAHRSIASAGNVLSNDVSVYIMLSIAVVLMIASVCVPYYTDSSGASSGVYGSGKDCLGYSGQDCMTMHALPIVTILIGFFAVLCMGAHISIPNISSIPGVKSLVTKIEGSIGTATTVPVLLLLAMLFSIITLATQLAMPLSGTSLVDQAKNSTNPTTFKDGMALSAASTALFVFVFLIGSGYIGKIVANITKR